MVNFGTSIVPIVVAFIGVTVGPILASVISILTSHKRETDTDDIQLGDVYYCKECKRFGQVATILRTSSN